MRRFFSTVILNVICFTSVVGAADQVSIPDLSSDPPIVFVEKGKTGLKNAQGAIIIPARYEKLGWSDGTLSIVQNVTGFRRDGQWGLIDLKGREVTEADYLELQPGDAAVIVGRMKLPGSVKIRAGGLNAEGKIVIPFQYDAIKITNFRAIVYQRNGAVSQYGLIDLQNNVLIPLKYKDVQPLGSLRYSVQDNSGRFAIFKEDGSPVTTFSIDSISGFENSFAFFFQNQMMGLIDREGQIKIEASYKQIERVGDNAFRVLPYDQWLLVNGDNELIQKLECDSVRILRKDRLALSKNGTVALIDQMQKSVSDKVFQAVSRFTDGKAIFRTNGEAGVLDIDGKILFSNRYRDLEKNGNQYRASVKADNAWRWTVLNERGEPIGYKLYDQIDGHNGLFYPVKHRGFWGALKTDGKEMVACVYDSLIDARFNLITVKFKGQYGIINTSDEWILVPQPARIKLLTSDRYFLKNGKTTFLKSMKHEIIYFTDNDIHFNEDHLIEHTSNGSTWRITLNGQIEQREIVPADVQVVSAEPESEGLTAVQKDGRYGFIDSRGRLRIANRYEGVKNFSEQLAAVKIRGKWGFINHNDNIAIQPNYDEVTSFENGLSLVMSKNAFGLIDKNGKAILPLRYQRIEKISDDRYLIQQNNQWGLASRNGQLILQAKYDRVNVLPNGYILVARDEKFGVLSSDGLNTIPEMYSTLYFDETLGCFVAQQKAEWRLIKL